MKTFFTVMKVLAAFVLLSGIGFCVFIYFVFFYVPRAEFIAQTPTGAEVHWEKWLFEDGSLAPGNAEIVRVTSNDVTVALEPETCRELARLINAGRTHQNLKYAGDGLLKFTFEDGSSLEYEIILEGFVRKENRFLVEMDPLKLHALLPKESPKEFRAASKEDGTH